MLEKKIIEKGQGFRITGIDYENVSWWRRDGKPMTLVVRMPKRNRPEFSVRSVVTEGIQGQPQLTFDSKEAAEQYLNLNPSLPSYYSVGWTNKPYECIKIPLTCENGEHMDGWLAVSNFPPEGSPEWDWLDRTFPGYFDQETGRGFFTESVNRNLNDAQIEATVYDPNLTEDQKCQKLWDRNYEIVSKLNNLNLSTNYVYNVRGREHDVFEEVREANKKIDQFRNRCSPMIHTCDLLLDNDCHTHPLEWIFDYYTKDEDEGGGGFNYKVHDWWEYIKISIEIWEDVLRWNTTAPETKRGFFTEAFINRDLSDEQIEEIALDQNLSNDEKCKRLWDRTWDQTLISNNAYYYAEANKLVKIPELMTTDSNGVLNKDKVFNFKYECRSAATRTCSSGGWLPWTCFMGNNESQPFDVKESYNYYVKVRYRKPPTQWWLYIKCLIEIYEKYVETETRKGFFRESYEEMDVPIHDSWKIKTPGQRCYRVKINIPTKTRHTFRLSVVTCTPYGSGASLQEICFLTKEDAERFIIEHDLPEYPNHPQNEDGKWYAYSARIPLTLIKVPLEDGTEAYIRKDCLPAEYSWTGDLRPEGHAWWEDMRQRYPQYFGTETRRGFFTENLITESLIDNWLMDNWNLTETELKELCEWNWDLEDNTGHGFCNIYPNIDNIPDDWAEGIVNPFYDETFRTEFDTLNEVIEHYGKEWTENWIEMFVQWLEANYEEMLEDIRGKRETRRGFFTESITTQVSSEEIEEIMSDENLTGEQQSQKLFGRSEDYIAEVQWCCYRADPVNFPDKFLTLEMRSLCQENLEEFKQKFNHTAGAAEQADNLTGKRTLFLTGDGKVTTLRNSYNYYVVESNMFLRSSLSDRAKAWWRHIKASVSTFENDGITEDRHETKRGFFRD